MSRLRVPLVAAAIAIGVACGRVSPEPEPQASVVPPGRDGASAAPPAGLTVEQVPQFVHFGFDDNGISGRDGSGTEGGLSFVTGLYAGRSNPEGSGNPRTYDGRPARFSFYAVTRYIERQGIDAPEHVKRQWREAVDAGHEIGLHTHGHPHASSFTAEQWSEEIAACRRWLTRPFDAARAAEMEVGIGVPADALSGFRAPYLEYGLPLFAALRAAGIAYDCSVEEGFDDAFDGTNLVWPYRVGEPGKETPFELWEIPAYILIVPPDEECERYGVPPGLRARMQQVQAYFDPEDGKISGFDWNLWVEFGMTRAEVVATARYTLDLRLAGNRAPFTFGTHSDLYSEQYQRATRNSTARERRQALAEILDYALGKPEVRVVSARQILDWMRAPAAL